MDTAEKLKFSCRNHTKNHHLHTATHRSDIVKKEHLPQGQQGLRFGETQGWQTFRAKHWRRIDKRQSWKGLPKVAFFQKRYGILFPLRW